MIRKENLSPDQEGISREEPPGNSLWARAEVATPSWPWFFNHKSLYWCCLPPCDATTHLGSPVGVGSVPESWQLPSQARASLKVFLSRSWSTAGRPSPECARVNSAGRDPRKGETWMGGCVTQSSCASEGPFWGAVYLSFQSTPSGTELQLPFQQTMLYCTFYAFSSFWVLLSLWAHLFCLRSLPHKLPGSNSLPQRLPWNPHSYTLFHVIHVISRVPSFSSFMLTYLATRSGQALNQSPFLQNKEEFYHFLTLAL